MQEAVQCPDRLLFGITGVPSFAFKGEGMVTGG